MKKIKKATAITMAATMALVPMNVLADTNSGEGTAEGEGGIQGWIETDQYNVTLPTSAKSDLTFVIDPQGLTGADEGNVTLDQLVGGTLTFTKDPLLSFTNKSSFDVGVNVNVALESNDDGLKVVSNEAEVESSTTDRNIYIAVQQMDISDPENPAPIAEFDIALAASDTEGLAGEKKFAYALKDAASEYEVSKTESGYSYALKAAPETTNFETVAFSLAGSVNSTGDWSGYAKAENPLTMNLEVSYSIDKLGKEADDMAEEFVDSTNVPGLLVAEKAPIVAIAPSAPETADFLSGKGVSGVYSTVISDVSVGKGDAAATDIASIKVGTATLTKLTAAPTTASVKGYIYDANAKTLTLYGPIIATTAAAGTKANLTITFNDDAGTTQTIELTNTSRQ